MKSWIIIFLYVIHSVGTHVFLTVHVQTASVSIQIVGVWLLIRDFLACWNGCVSALGGITSSMCEIGHTYL